MIRAAPPGAAWEKWGATPSLLILIVLSLLLASADQLAAFKRSPQDLEVMLGSVVPDGWPEFPEAIDATLACLGFCRVAEQSDSEVGAVWEWRIDHRGDNG